jgi:hypothetical protein
MPWVCERHNYPFHSPLAIHVHSVTPNERGPVFTGPFGSWCGSGGLEPQTSFSGFISVVGAELLENLSRLGVQLFHGSDHQNRSPHKIPHNGRSHAGSVSL